jgi:hypothetical protein
MPIAFGILLASSLEHLTRRSSIPSIMSNSADHKVKPPHDELLLPWALKHDPECARIILAVQAKAANVKEWWLPPPEKIPVSGTQDATIFDAPKRTLRPCSLCGSPFLAKRADAQFCSDRCRNKASYRRGQRGNPRRTA